MLQKLLISAAVTFGGLFMLSLPAIAAETAESDRLQTRTATVTGEVRYSRNSDGRLSNFRVRIDRNGQNPQEFRLPSYGELYGAPIYLSEYGAAFSGIAADIKVIDLDANGEPEVLLDLADSGLYNSPCNATSFIYSYSSSQQQYTPLMHRWGNCSSSYWSATQGTRQLTELNSDRRLEFVARDDRFLREFTGYANLTAPTQIWQYQQGRLVDVTRSFPDRVYQNAYQLWRNYQQIRSRSGASAARAPMAAYVGAKFLLGQREDAMQRLRQAYPNLGDRPFVDQVGDFMLHSGYYQP